jgi:hypothetical protein
MAADDTPHPCSKNTHTHMEIDSVSLCNNCILGKHHNHHPQCHLCLLSFVAMGQESDELGAGANCF